VLQTPPCIRKETVCTGLLMCFSWRKTAKPDCSSLHSFKQLFPPFQLAIGQTIIHIDTITVYVIITVMKARLTLDELANEVQTMLGGRGLLEAQADGRISPAPDPRTVRYYTTLGLLDRPEIVAREARYGRRHVLQLCAIKSMQAAGLPLADIQARLYAKTDSELEAFIASVSETRRQRSRQVHAIIWTEVTIEPGLKILAEQGWTPVTSDAALEDRIRAALAALKNGGSK
jgi:DNA-binding transcriptional MerR regulator